MFTGFRQWRSARSDGLARHIRVVESESPGNQEPAASETVFRNFCMRDFRPTEGWFCLKRIINSNGGCFGLYGPRGAGKSWLMHRAIVEVEEKGGLGLWFPCPRKYNATDFLFTLTDNLANAVERRLARKKAFISSLGRLRNFTLTAVAVLLAFALISYTAIAVAATGKASSHPAVSFSKVYPVWLWILIGSATLLCVIASVTGFIYNTTAGGSLLREAASLRERIRFSENLKLSAAFGISGSQGIAPALSQSRERTLLERPTTVASLVFDFRNFAEHIVRELKRPLLVCVDELDKIDDTDEMRSLLRDIKGIFEVDGTFFLVSISEEAATSLKIGILQTGGRNELNSSFYSIIALPPLQPSEADELLLSRGFGRRSRLACALCLLAAGNRRELVRMADLCDTFSRQSQVRLDETAIVAVLAEESLALLYLVTKTLPGQTSPVAGDDIKYRAWTALSREYFNTTEKFIEFGIHAIRDLWEPAWADENWASVRESWRRLLIRLFIAAKVLPFGGRHPGGCLLDDHAVVLSLQSTLVMATRDSGVARLMLHEYFGGDLSGEYRAPAVPGTR